LISSCRKKRVPLYLQLEIADYFGEGKGGEKIAQREYGHVHMA
jgi:hypothetical protein